jgi:hypothetical protein
MKIKDKIVKESDQVFILFSKNFGLVSMVILAIQILRNGNKSENWDKTIFLLSILIGLISYLRIFIFKTQTFIFDSFSFIFAITGVLLGVGGIEKHDPINGVVLSNRLWLGFGPYSLIILLVMSFMVWQIWGWNQLPKLTRMASSSIALLIVVFSGISFWQDAKSLIDPDHSEYVLNEVMAIKAGNWPYESFIPQYQTAYSFLIAPFNQLSVAPTVQSVLVLMFLVSMIAIIVGVLLVKISLPTKSFTPAILIVVPLTALTQFPNREGLMGSIASLLSGLPIRIFPGVAFLALAYWAITLNPLRHKLRNSLFVVTGLIAGWVIWNSQDFGIAACVSIIALIVILPKNSGFNKLKTFGMLLIGFIPGFFTINILYKLFGHEVNYDYFAFFARQFGSGFGAENMRTPGPLLVILPLLISLIASHFKVLQYSFNNSNVINEKLYANSVLGLLFAFWSIIGFSYYLNRSYASGQMQILFLPTSISLGALIGSILLMRSTELRTIDEIHGKNLLKKSSRHFITLTLVVTLPLSAVILSPNPRIEINRIVESEGAPRQLKPSIVNSITDSKSGLEFVRLNGGTVAFFGASSNYVSAETGIKSASIFNSPYDMAMSNETIRVACGYIEKIKSDYLVLSDEGAALFQFKDKTLCETYEFVENPTIRVGRFAKRIS